jgi:multidrug efflux pump subunit AcrA (membrane-fusion protein)
MNTKNRIIFGATAVVLMGGSIALSYTLLKPKPVEKNFVTAEAHHMKEVVRADGTVKPAQSVDLSFERGGRIARVYKNVGDSVKAGEVLMELENGTEATLVSQARALLEQRRAGASEAEINIYKAAVDIAKADTEKTKTDTQALIMTAQAALETAQNNLKLASGGDQSQIVEQAYESTLATLQAAIPQMDNGLNQADAVLGIDHTSALINLHLSALDETKLANARNQYTQTKAQVQLLRTSVPALTSTASHETIDTTIASEEATLKTLNQLLSSVSDVLKATPSGGASDQATLATMQTTTQQVRSTLSAQSTQLVTAKQAIENAKNSLNTYAIAYNKAVRDLANTQASAASLVHLKEAAYQQAVANLANKTQPTRWTDLAPLRASLDAASVAYDKTLLRSPIDGIISAQSGKTGAIISPNIPTLSVINNSSFQLEALVPETDLAKIKTGNAASITTDAYGTATPFAATVVAIDPNVSTVNGVTGYKVTLQFSQNDDRIKDGLTANATITTQEKDAPIALPERSLLQKNGAFVVLVEGTDGQTKEQTVQVGVRSADGWREVVSGVNAGDHVQDFGN